MIRLVDIIEYNTFFISLPILLSYYTRYTGQ